MSGISGIWSLWTLIVGIASPFCGITAIITGVLALLRAKQYSPRQARRGLAIAGIVLGVVLLLSFLPATFVSLVALYCINGC